MVWVRGSNSSKHTHSHTYVHAHLRVQAHTHTHRLFLPLPVLEAVLGRVGLNFNNESFPYFAHAGASGTFSSANAIAVFEACILCPCAGEDPQANRGEVNCPASPNYRLAKSEFEPRSL